MGKYLFGVVFALCLFPGCDVETLGTLEGSVVPAGALPTVLIFSSDEGEIAAEVRPGRQTGEFRVSLAPGTYDLTITASGYITDETLTEVRVSTDQTTSLDQIILYRAGSGSIGGRVEPADAEASVSALQFGAVISSVNTDSSGEFLINDLPTGVYELVVSATGYERATAGPFQVSEGQTTMVDPIVLVESTTPTGSLAGIVLPAEAEATINVNLEGVPIATAQASSSDGSWQIEGLEVGFYDVVISADGYTTDRSLTGVEVTADAETDVGAITLSIPDRVLSGEVTDGDSGSPVPGVRVFIGAIEAVTGSDGTYQLADPPTGLQTIHMERPFYLPYSALVEIQEEGAAEHSTMLAPTGRISGVVIGEGGGPLSGAVVIAGDAMATTNSEGAFQLIHLRPGMYQARVDVTGYSPAQQTAEVLSGTVFELDFSLVRSGNLRGTVEESGTGMAVSGAMITVGGRAGSSNSDGDYEITGIPAGSHSVRVSAPTFESTSRSVTISSGSTATMDFSLIPVPRVTITGRVTDVHSGEPVENVNVYAGTGYDFRGGTDATGYYSIPRRDGDPLVPSDFTVIRTSGGSASGREYPSKIVEVDLASGSLTITVNIELDRYASVLGRVVDSETGEGIEGERVSCSGSSTTDSDGYFFVSEINPGDISCYHYLSECYPSSSIDIELGSGETGEVLFLLERFADLSVLVLSAEDDSPINNAQVEILGLSDERITETGSDGSATFECVPHGLKTLLGWATGYSSAATHVIVPDRGEVDAWIHLPIAGGGSE